MILHDWKCPKHGVFESSHPICPSWDCESEGVEKIFLKAPGYVSDLTRRTDAGIRASADSMGLTNFRSAQPGEASHGGELGKKVLWGEDVKKEFPGHTMETLAAQAKAGETVRRADGAVEHIPAGMIQAANSGITQRVLPRAERHIAKEDSK